MSRRLVLAFVALLVSSGAGCIANDDAQVSKHELRDLVVQPDDLAADFTRFDFGELTSTDARAGPRFEESRFGREGGWKARYRRSASAKTSGPLVIESTVDLFGDDDGARQDLEAYEEEFEASVQEGEARVLNEPDVGEGAAAVTLARGSGRFSVRFYTVAWRQGPITASVSVNGFEGRITLEDALELARKQDRRIGRVLR
jgi:hypothetical protein